MVLQRNLEKNTVKHKVRTSSEDESLYQNFVRKLASISSDIMSSNIVVLALSGGVDSISLLHLLIGWSAQNNKKLIAITINHNLRKEAASEAAEISEYCKFLGIEHHVINWDHNNIQTSIQEKARNARYNLLSSFCQPLNIKYVFTAHHLGDQIEQIMISLNQGAAIYSFYIPELAEFNGITILRPLLDFPKETLISYCISNGFKWWKDGSNEANEYLRNKVRPMAESLLSISDNKKILTSICNIKRASQSLTNITNKYIASNISFSELGYAKFNISNYILLEEEIRFSLIRFVILRIGRQRTEIRLHSIKIIDSAISTKTKKSLGGCYVLFTGEFCVIVRDFAREEPKIDVMNENVIWDHRFKIKTQDHQNIKRISAGELNLLIKAKPDLLNFDNQLPNNIKKIIILSLPSIFYLEKLVAIHHIYRYDMGDHISDMQIEFLK